MKNHCLNIATKIRIIRILVEKTLEQILFYAVYSYTSDRKYSKMNNVELYVLWKNYISVTTIAKSIFYLKIIQQ